MFDSLVEANIAVDYGTMTSAMEGYLSDLNTFMAMEAIDVKSKMKELGTKFSEFVRKSRIRVMQVIDAILRRIGEMANAIGNLTHVKEIAVPNDLFKAYNTLIDGAAEITEDASKYTQSIRSKIQDIANYSGEKLAADARNRDELRERVSKLTDADILKDMSVADYMNDKLEPEGRSAKVNPSKEQARITKMRTTWTMLKRAYTADYQMMDHTLQQSQAIFDEGTNIGRSVMASRQFAARVFSTNMAITTGMLAVLSRLQKYVSAFIQIDKKYPVIKEEPMEGRGYVEGEEPWRKAPPKAFPSRA